MADGDSSASGCGGSDFFLPPAQNHLEAIVGNIESRGVGDRQKSEDQPLARQVAHAPQPPMWSADKEREPVPISRDAERPVPNARRNVARRSKG